jgi:Ca-activated chloride channel family protein
MQARNKPDGIQWCFPGVKAIKWLVEREFSLVLLLVAMFMASLFMVSSLAVAKPQMAGERLVQLSQVNFGALLLRSKEPGKYIEAPLVAADIEIKVTGIVARATLTQRFKNPSKGWVEGKYVFPLPENAAVDRLRMMIGERFIEGQIKERKEAKIIYEKAKAEGKKAALVEQERPNMFTNSVANIGPGETVVIQLEYQHEVKLDNGSYSLRVPLVAAPRYLSRPVIHMVSQEPGRTTFTVNDPVPDADRVTPPVQNPENGKRNPVSLSVRLDPGFPVGKISSPHHGIAVKSAGGATLVALAEGEVWADRDFELVWTPQAGSSPGAQMFKEIRDGKTYLLAMINPPAASGKGQGKPREVIFVIDNSGSMAGESMRQAKAGLLFALGRLKPQDSFNVIRFDDTMDELFQVPVEANASNIAMAKGFVEGLEANGGTEMLLALKAALADAHPQDETRLRQVIFLTDGAIGNESQLFDEIQRSRGRSRIFTVGIGSAPNSYFMTRAATYGRGAFTHVGQTSQVKARMEILARKLENPAMTNLKVTFPQGADPESWPNPLPDLYLGEPIVLTARLENPDGEISLGGTFDGKPWSMMMKVDQARDGAGVAKLWARRKIMALEGIRYQIKDWKAHDAMVLKVALDYGLVSRLTSLVAVDVTPSRPASAGLVSADIPLNLPRGWNFDKVFGAGIAPLDKADMRIYEKSASLINASAEKPDLSRMKKKGIPLPAGATLADRKIIMGLMLIFFALAFGMVLVFWRHLGQVFAPDIRPVK